MPRSSAQRRPSPRPLEIKRYEVPRPANDRSSTNNQDRPGQSPKTFGNAPSRTLQDAGDEALRRGGRVALSALINVVVPRPIQMGLNGLEYIDTIMTRGHVYKVVQNPGTGWILVNECKGGPAGDRWYQLSAYPGPNSLAAVCLGAQAGTQTTPEDSINVHNQSGLTWGQWNGLTDIDRYQHIRNYGRTRPSNIEWFHSYGVAHPNFRRINPNIQRFINPTPQPLPRPAPARAPSPHRIITIAPRPRNRPAPQQAAAARSKPPPSNTKEIKGTAGKLGAKMFEAIDYISEASEVVDALYQALPKDVRKRWNRPDRPGDNAGQYGIDGADYKLQALWHNWSKLDVNEAIKNVLYNQLEDKLYGEAYRARNNLTGRGRKRPRGHFG